MSSREHQPATSNPAFVTTRWTRVLEARGTSVEAKAALSDLCDAYYSPVLAFIRREVRDEDSARELTQEFFARLLVQHGLDSVDPARGRFRSFLLGAVKHFLSNQRAKSSAAKRGGGVIHETLDQATDTSPGLEVADPNAQFNDTFFDRQWALALMERALVALKGEFNEAAKAGHFQVLKPWLVGDNESLSQAEAASLLGMSEGALKVAIHRLRKRFRELIRSEILQTVGTTEQVDQELRYLVEVLALDATSK